MISRLARFALFAVLAVLAWNFLLKPATRQRFRGYIEVLAFALLAASALALIWRWYQG
ncbi:hypothetical protein [Chitinimonas sp.]|uniref:protein MIGRI n=1 Tax=Chitinimonas sp. TaxID=1934313 RepID=UPI0035B1E993